MKVSVRFSFNLKVVMVAMVVVVVSGGGGGDGGVNVRSGE